MSWPLTCNCSLLDLTVASCCLNVDILNLNSGSLRFGKVMRRICTKFRFQVPLGIRAVYK